MPEPKTLPTQVNPYELCARITSLEEKLITGLETINNGQALMSEDISKIKEAVYNPDVGLYARLRVVESDKKSNAKILWLILSMLVGSLGAYLVNLL
jgi:hypothetical protein|tara:strand:+ start:2199 stop:2489 length:291 start_codon:yes stop_codon:yes gene_type:complete